VCVRGGVQSKHDAIRRIGDGYRIILSTLDRGFTRRDLVTD
jgi:hypothetical protein